MEESGMDRYLRGMRETRMVVRARNDDWRLGWMAAAVRAGSSRQLGPVRVGPHAKRRAQADLAALDTKRPKASS